MHLGALAATLPLIVLLIGIPLLSPLFGTIGVFLTGSNTSANALFGNLQNLTAQGMGLSFPGLVP